MINYFELMSVPPGFVVDRSLLSRNYLQLQKKFHPDYFAQATEAEKEKAEEMTAYINQAFAVLSQPMQTVRYVLLWKGVLTEEEKQPLPPNFLSQVMELNEMKMDGADEQTIKARAADLLKEIEKPVETLLSVPLPDWDSPNHLQLARDWYFQKKYIDRLLAE
jgi:molecular chaperone HscB